MESSNNSENGVILVSSFQMPLHYPRYTKNDYESMPEWELDRLLAEYGLAVQGHDLEYKRDFAMGAFLWPDFAGQKVNNKSGDSNGVLHQDSVDDDHEWSKIFELFRHILGFSR